MTLALGLTPEAKADLFEARFYWIENDRIVVFAIWHGRRDPHGWRERLSS